MAIRRKTRDGYEILVAENNLYLRSGMTIYRAVWEIRHGVEGAVVAEGRADTEQNALEDALETLHDIRPEQR